MMSVGEKTLHNLFKKDLKLPDYSAASLLEAIEGFLEFERKNANNSVATNEDIRTLELQLETLKEDNHKEQSKTELYGAISQSKFDIYKAVSDRIIASPWNCRGCNSYYKVYEIAR